MGSLSTLPQHGLNLPTTSSEEMVRDQALLAGGGRSESSALVAGAVIDLQVGDRLGAKHGGQSIDSKATESFALAESLPVVPVPLVDKIQKGKFVDLCDLLQDNILLAKKSASEGGL